MTVATPASPSPAWAAGAKPIAEPSSEFRVRSSGSPSFTVVSSVWKACERCQRPHLLRQHRAGAPAPVARSGHTSAAMAPAWPHRRRRANRFAGGRRDRPETGARATQAHQMFGDAGCDQVGKFLRQTGHAERTLFGQKVEDAPSRVGSASIRNSVSVAFSVRGSVRIVVHQRGQPVQNAVRVGAPLIIPLRYRANRCVPCPRSRHG